jgi:hypothetical protein
VQANIRKCIKLIGINKSEQVTELEICELEKKDERAWDEYLLKSEHSTFYHQIGWRNVVKKTYKHKPIYLIAKEEGEIKFFKYS